MKIFSEEILVPPESNEIEISIFGPGYGESIVIHIPHVGWGIIDSCKKEIGGKSVVPPLQYLLELLAPYGYPELAFILLTHPHEDHYKGLDKIIRKYPGGVKRICRYGGNSVRELKTYITQQRIGLNDPLPGLVDVFNAMGEAVRLGSQKRALSEMVSIVDLKNVEIDNYGTADIKLVALSPSADSLDRYSELLFKAIPEEGKPLKPLNDREHNIISVSLLLKAGDVQAPCVRIDVGVP